MQKWKADANRQSPVSSVVHNGCMSAITQTQVLRAAACACHFRCSRGADVRAPDQKPSSPSGTPRPGGRRGHLGCQTSEHRRRRHWLRRACAVGLHRLAAGAQAQTSEHAPSEAAGCRCAARRLPGAFWPSGRQPTHRLVPPCPKMPQPAATCPQQEGSPQSPTALPGASQCQRPSQHPW